MKPGKHQRSKQRCKDLCWKVHDPVQSFALPSTLHMNYVTNTFLLVSPSVRSKQLLCLCRIKAKKLINNIQRRTLMSFISIPPLITRSRQCLARVRAAGLDDEKEDHETSNVNEIQRRKLQEKQQNKAK